MLAPDRHARLVRGNERLAAEEEARIHLTEGRTAAFDLGERDRDVDILHEAVVEDDAVKAIVERLHLDPSFLRHNRYALDLHRQDDDPVVQHLVVLEVVEQRMRHALGAGRQEDGGALHALQRSHAGCDEHLHRHRALVEMAAHDLPPARPRGEQGEGDRRDQQWKPAAVGHLGQVRREIGAIDDQEGAGDPHRERLGPFPDRIGQHAQHAGGNEHRACNRDAISRRQVARAAEADRDDDHQQQQRPVDEGYVDLPRRLGAGVDDLETRQEAQLHRLLRDREGARDHRLARDHGGHRGEDHERQPCPVRRHQVERVLDHPGIGQQQCALAHIIEQQAGQRDVQPRNADRLAPEMAHVGVQCLRARYRQHDRAQRQEGQLGIDQEKTRRPHWVDAAQDHRMRRHAADAQHRQHEEIEDHDRPEQYADPGRAIGLDRKQPDQDDDRDRQHEGGERIADRAQPLDRGEDRDGGRDDRVAIE